MIGPEILCQTLKIAAGRAAIGLKCVMAREAARPEFCIPTSMETDLLIASSIPKSLAIR